MGGVEETQALSWSTLERWALWDGVIEEGRFHQEMFVIVFPLVRGWSGVIHILHNNAPSMPTLWFRAKRHFKWTVSSSSTCLNVSSVWVNSIEHISEKEITVTKRSENFLVISKGTDARENIKSPCIQPPMYQKEKEVCWPTSHWKRYFIRF